MFILPQEKSGVVTVARARSEWSLPGPLALFLHGLFIQRAERGFSFYFLRYGNALDGTKMRV